MTKDIILKHFQEVKANIIKRLDEAILQNTDNEEIDDLLDSLNEVNILINDILKSK